MNRQFFFILFNANGSLLKKVGLTKKRLLILSIFFIFCFAGSIYVVYDYIQTKQKVTLLQELENRVLMQTDKLLCQQQQIQNFLKEINKLKLKLIDLSAFEKKLRIISNIDNNSDNQQSFLNVGGPVSTDIDAANSLNLSFNSIMSEMQDQIKCLNSASEKQSQAFNVLYKHCEEQRSLLASTPSISPVLNKGWISSRFGYRKSPFTNKREFHNGLDICAGKGEPIVATADGVIKFAGRKRLMGKTVIINHGHGMTTLYGHADTLLVKKGDAVKRGDIIAKIGTTGRTTGPHVHYTVLLNGISVNPVKYIF